MSPEKLSLVTSTEFIRYSGLCYSWAIEREREVREMSVRRIHLLKSYKGGRDYADMALTLTQQAFRMSHPDIHITKVDLIRSKAILDNAIPRDFVGMVYVWFTTYVPLYIPSSNGLVIHTLDAGNATVIVDQLFMHFMAWCEKTDRVNYLKKDGLDQIYLDEVRGQFNLLVQSMTHQNSYLAGIFNTPAENANLSKADDYQQVTSGDTQPLSQQVKG